jgi:hypothetical protein
MVYVWCTLLKLSTSRCSPKIKWNKFGSSRDAIRNQMEYISPDRTRSLSWLDASGQYWQQQQVQHHRPDAVLTWTGRAGRVNQKQEAKVLQPDATKELTRRVYSASGRFPEKDFVDRTRLVITDRTPEHVWSLSSFWIEVAVGHWSVASGHPDRSVRSTRFLLSWHITVEIEWGGINTSPTRPCYVSCSFVQLKNTFQVQGSARALVRIEIW